jgi:hypothetical protein
VPNQLSHKCVASDKSHAFHHDRERIREERESLLDEPMDNRADHEPPAAATQDDDPDADTDIYLPGHGFNPKGEAERSDFVSKWANMDMSWVESFLADMEQSLSEETETRPSQPGPGDTALRGRLQQLADDTYALREPEPPKTRQDLLREVEGVLEDGPSSRIISPWVLLRGMLTASYQDDRG